MVKNRVKMDSASIVDLVAEERGTSKVQAKKDIKMIGEILDIVISALNDGDCNFAKVGANLEVELVEVPAKEGTMTQKDGNVVSFSNEAYTKVSIKAVDSVKNRFNPNK